MSLPSAGMPYSAPSYAPPAYPPPSYPPPSPGFGSPIPLIPLVSPGAAEGALAEEGGGFLLKKLSALPLILLLPILLVIVVVALGGGGGGGGLLNLLGKKKKKKKYEYDYPMEYPYEAPPPMVEQPYISYERSGAVNTQGPNRSARDTKESSGLPALSVHQVEKLTSIVFTALRNQECVQRLLCETGSFSRSFSTAKMVAKAVDKFVPESLRSSYDIFTKADQCEQYVCGDLPVKK